MIVAPRAGAWIETYSADKSRKRNESRPARARGLKLIYAVVNGNDKMPKKGEEKMHEKGDGK